MRTIPFRSLTIRWMSSWMVLVFPEPGGPHMRIPRLCRKPRAVNLSFMDQNWTKSSMMKFEESSGMTSRSSVLMGSRVR